MRARPDIILITIDSLRADHIGAYGYKRPTSPSIDALAAEAVMVRNHIAQAPYTKASMASMFTGLFPTAHKAFTTSRPFAEAMTGHVAGGVPYTDVLDDRISTLAERMAAAGYHTIGLMTNPVLLADFGFDQGFAQYEFLTPSASDTEFAPAPRVVQRALQVIDGQRPQKPLFLWLHVMEPHSPYRPPEDVAGKFQVLTPPRPIDGAAIPSWVRIGDSTDLNLYLARYDADIRSADDALGEFFTALKARGLWDPSVIVLTADHGEEFMDHGGMEHNRTLYDEMLRVPLIVKASGLRPRIVDAQTQSVDLVPTIASLAGQTVQPAEVHGRNIWSVLEGRGGAAPNAYAEIVGLRFALRTPKWKLISSLQGGKELFDLTSDPAEQNNLARSNPALVGQLENTLARIVASSVKAGEHIQGQYAPIPPVVLDRLRSLGYVR
jgi:arylsulfatase